MRPLLVASCQECHGAQKQQGGLRLDSREAVLAGGDSGPAIVPGKPEESLLIKAVHYDDANRQMPPKGQLRSEDVVALTTWVKLGAPWPVRKDEGGRMKDEAEVAASGSSFIPQPSALQHWSFQPVGNPPIPAVENGAWPKQTLDHFVLHKLEAAELKPSVPADKRTLHPAGNLRSDRSAADAGRDRSLPCGRFGRRLRTRGRSASLIAALRRTLGAALARCGPLR